MLGGLFRLLLLPDFPQADTATAQAITTTSTRITIDPLRLRRKRRRILHSLSLKVVMASRSVGSHASY
jgi:hypothetical protein